MNCFQVSIIFWFLICFVASNGDMIFTFNYGNEPLPQCIYRSQIAFYESESKFGIIFRHDLSSRDLIEECQRVTLDPINSVYSEEMKTLARSESASAMILKDQVIFYRKNYDGLQQNGYYIIYVTVDDFVPVEYLESLLDSCWVPHASTFVPVTTKLIGSPSQPENTSHLPSPAKSSSISPSFSNVPDSSLIPSIKKTTAAPLIQTTTSKENCSKLPLWVSIVLGILASLFIVIFCCALGCFNKLESVRDELQNLKPPKTKAKFLKEDSLKEKQLNEEEGMKLSFPSAEQIKSIESKSISSKKKNQTVKSSKSGTKETVTSQKRTTTTNESKTSGNIEASSAIPKTEEKLLPPTSNNAPKTKSEDVLINPNDVKPQAAVKTETQAQNVQLDKTQSSKHSGKQG